MVMTQRSRAGLTMIEVLVASVILTALVAMSSWLIWGSAKHVSRMEIEMSMDNGAREFITLLTKEIHQTAMPNIQWVDETQMIDYTTTTDTPGSLQAVAPTGFGRPVVAPNPAGAPPIWDNIPPPAGRKNFYFNAIRFKVPGPMMEITTKNANPNLNGTIDLATKKEIDNFDLQKFKNNADHPDYLYEIQYWWEIDTTTVNSVPVANVKGEGLKGAGPNGYIPNGLDDNGNGVIDEGVVKKSEVWKNSDGTIRERRLSTVLRGVKSLTFTIPGVKWNGVDASGKPLWTGGAILPGSERILTVTLVMESTDPNVPRSKAINPDTLSFMHVIQKTYASMIEVRNNK